MAENELYPVRARRWVRYGDGTLGGDRAAGPRERVVVNEYAMIEVHGRVDNGLPLVLDADAARWIGTRLIEAAAMLEAEMGVEEDPHGGD